MVYICLSGIHLNEFPCLGRQLRTFTPLPFPAGAPCVYRGHWHFGCLCASSDDKAAILRVRETGRSGFYGLDDKERTEVGTRRKLVAAFGVNTNLEIRSMVDTPPNGSNPLCPGSWGLSSTFKVFLIHSLDRRAVAG